jgi:hypothetical protein
MPAFPTQGRSFCDSLFNISLTTCHPCQCSITVITHPLSIVNWAQIPVPHGPTAFPSHQALWEFCNGFVETSHHPESFRINPQISGHLDSQPMEFDPMILSSSQETSMLERTYRQSIQDSRHPTPVHHLQLHSRALPNHLMGRLLQLGLKT